MFDKIEKNLRLIKYLITHKAFVAWAGIAKVRGIPLKQLLVHDTSKFSREEYQTYRKKFRPLEGEDELPQSQWDEALVHHYNSNQHHPEHWRIGNRPIPMPDRYIKEMIADWLGAGRALTGSWDLTEFLSNRFDSFTFHPKTSLQVIVELREIGYDLRDGTFSHQ